MLSIALGSKTTAEGAYLHHVEQLQLASGGTWAVTVGETNQVGLNSFEQPLEESPAHGFVDFRDLSRGATEARAKTLRALASGRGCLYTA